MAESEGYVDLSLPIAVKYTGIDDLVAALRGVDDHLLRTIQESLIEAGEIVADDAYERFSVKFGERRSIKSALSVAYTASHFQTQARGVTSGTRVRVGVGQGLRKKTGKRPDWGADQVKYALLPARDANMDRVAEILETDVYGLLHSHGF